MLKRIPVLVLFTEFIGSMTLATAVFSMSGRTTFPFFGAIIAGLIYAAFVLAVRPINVHINPIVTVGAWTLRQIDTLRAVVVIAAQMLGGVAAWQFMEYLLDRPLQAIAGDTLEWRVLAAEAFGAAIFTYIITAVAARRMSDAEQAFTAGIGLAVGMIAASLASNGLINPALAVGLQSWSWAYAAGPVAGALVGMNLYVLLTAADARIAATGTKKKTSAAKTEKKPVKKTAAKTKKTTKKKK